MDYVQYSLDSKRGGGGEKIMIDDLLHLART